MCAIIKIRKEESIMSDPKGAVEVVSELMEKQGFTPSSLGKRIGVKASAVWDRLYKEWTIK